VLGADEDCYGAHKHIMSYLLYTQAGTNGSSIGVCRIGDATSETLLRTAHLPCLVNSDQFSMLGADEDCYGAHKRITSCLLHVNVGTNGSSIGVCRIGDATYETPLKLAISRARRLSRRPVDVRRQPRVSWCTQAYHELSITYTSWYEWFQYRSVLYW